MTRHVREGYARGKKGHGERRRRGRFASSTSDSRVEEAGSPERNGERDESEAARRAVVRSMDRLLALGDVEASSRFVDAAGSRLHYLEAGRGEPLILLQGAGGGAANWYRVMGPLARRFRVLALDLPGFGLSAPIPVRAPLGVAGADIVASWLQALGIDRCDVVGTSFGGLLALRLAQRARLVRRLGLLDSAGLGQAVPLSVRMTAIPGVAELAMRPSRWGTKWLFRRLLTTERRGLPAEQQEALIDYITSSAAAGEAHAMAGSLRLFTGLVGQREVLSDEELNRITQPTLIVWGALDPFLPAEHGARAAELIPGASLRVIPGTGHSPNWEMPEVLLELLLPFLAEAEPSETGTRG